MPLSKKKAKELHDWLETVQNFSIRLRLRVEGVLQWLPEEVISDWIFEDSTNRLAYSQAFGDRAHVVAIESASFDGDGWELVDSEGTAILLAILWPAQNDAANDWRAQRPETWDRPLRARLAPEPEAEEVE